jgi:hypothetical protein
VNKDSQARSQWADPEMRAKMLEGMRRARELKAKGLAPPPKPRPEAGTSRAARGQLREGRPGDHRCTPRRILVAAAHAAGIKRWDLDPASNRHSIVPAETAWYGEGDDDNGLVLDWFGDTWLNPPFSAMDVWTAKSIDELVRVRSLTFLGPGDTSTEWWRTWKARCDAWAAWPRREHFPLPDNPKGSPPGPVHLFYTGPRSNRWRQVMEHVGCVTYPGG